MHPHMINSIKKNSHQVNWIQKGWAQVFNMAMLPWDSWDHHVEHKPKVLKNVDVKKTEQKSPERSF